MNICALCKHCRRGEDLLGRDWRCLHPQAPIEHRQCPVTAIVVSGTPRCFDRNPAGECADYEAKAVPAAKECP